MDFFYLFRSSDLDLDTIDFIYKDDPYFLEMSENELCASRISKVIILKPAKTCIYQHVVTSRHITKMTVTPFGPISFTLRDRYF